jgi:hypothetical protein
VQPHLEPEGVQEGGEGAVELEAEPAAAAFDHLVDEQVGVEVDVLVEVDAEVLEGDPMQVRGVQRAQGLRGGPPRGRHAQAFEVGRALAGSHARSTVGHRSR